MNTESLQGKAVLVTGAGSGLGEATARAFARAGCAVACVDINGKAAGLVSRELDTQETRSIAIQCDASDAQAVIHTVLASARAIQAAGYRRELRRHRLHAFS